MVVVAGILGIVVDEGASLFEQRDNLGVTAFAGEPERRAAVGIGSRGHSAAIQQQANNVDRTAFGGASESGARVEAVAVQRIGELRHGVDVGCGGVENRTHSGNVVAQNGGVQIHQKQQSTMKLFVLIGVVGVVGVRALSTQVTGRPNSAQTSSSVSGGDASDAAWLNAATLSLAMPMGDNMFATTPQCACASQHLLLTKFVHLDSDRALRDKPLQVPDGATIRGIELLIHRAVDSGALIDETDVVLVRAGAVISGNLAGKSSTNAARWPPIAAATTFTYGGRTNLWGVASPLTPAIVNDDSLGVAIRVRSQAAAGVAKIDYVRLSIFYDTPDAMFPSPISTGAADGGASVPGSATAGASNANVGGGGDATVSGVNQGGQVSSSPAGASNVGLIVGVVVGVLLCCLLLALVAFLLLKRRKRERDNHGDIHTESFAFDQSSSPNMLSARSQRADTGASVFPDVPDSSSRRGANVQSNYVNSPDAAQQGYGGIQPSVQQTPPHTDGYGTGARRATSPSNYASSPAASSAASAPYGSTRPAAATVSSGGGNYGSGRAAPLQYNKAIDIHGHDQYNQRPVHQQFGT
jgi:hypothetical protein